MTLSHIVAMSENHVIGRAGGLPWHIPEDFKFFKQTTLGHVLIMGRKTYDSIGKPLPGRLSIVVSRQSLQQSGEQVGLRFCPDLASAIELAKGLAAEWGDEIFIGGGGEIYRQSIDMVDRIYLTKIKQDIDGDTRYPEFDPLLFSQRLILEREEPVPFSIYLYERLKSRV